MTLCFWICNLVFIKVKGYNAHRTENELSIERGKNLALSIMSHSIVVMYCGGGVSTIDDIAVQLLLNFQLI